MHLHCISRPNFYFLSVLLYWTKSPLCDEVRKILKNLMSICHKVHVQPFLNTDKKNPKTIFPKKTLKQNNLPWRHLCTLAGSPRRSERWRNHQQREKKEAGWTIVIPVGWYPSATRRLFCYKTSGTTTAMMNTQKLSSGCLESSNEVKTYSIVSSFKLSIIE